MNLWGKNDAQNIQNAVTGLGDILLRQGQAKRDNLIAAGMHKKNLAAAGYDEARTVGVNNHNDYVSRGRGIGSMTPEQQQSFALEGYVHGLDPTKGMSALSQRDFLNSANNPDVFPMTEDRARNLLGAQGKASTKDTRMTTAYDGRVRDREDSLGKALKHMGEVAATNRARIAEQGKMVRQKDEQAFKVANPAPMTGSQLVKVLVGNEAQYVPASEAAGKPVAFAPNKETVVKEGGVPAAIAKDDEKYLGAERENASNAAEMNSALNHAKTLLEKGLQPGAFADVKKDLLKVAQAFGVLGLETDIANAESFDAVANRLGFEATKALKGAISEKELAFAKAQMPLLTTTEAGNRYIIEMYLRGNENKIRRYQALKGYIAQNGSSHGFEESWQRYLEETAPEPPSIAPGANDADVAADALIKKYGGGHRSKGAPSVGDVIGGYRYIGGDLRQKNSWELVR